MVEKKKHTAWPQYSTHGLQVSASVLVPDEHVQTANIRGEVKGAVCEPSQVQDISNAEVNL